MTSKSGIPSWQRWVQRQHEALRDISFHARSPAEIGSKRGFERWRSLTERLRKAAGTIFLVGNGASASMASHLAADLAKNALLHTQVFSDLSLITAISNDMGYEHVFSEPLLRRGRRGDMLVAISSSGRSPNVLAAARVARELKMKVITLTAMRPDNPLRALGDLNAYVAVGNYGEAETCHAAVLHHWMDLVEVSRPLASTRAPRKGPR